MVPVRSRKGPIQGRESGPQTKRDKRLLKGARVLVVDDDELTCKMLERILLSAGCEVVSARGTWEVATILAAQERSFDGAVVDMRLEDGRGSSVVASLRSQRPPCSALMITGYDDDGAASDSIAAGADDFLLKPFSADQFLTAVADAIEKTARWRQRLNAKETADAQHDRARHLRDVSKTAKRSQRRSAPKLRVPPTKPGTSSLGFLDLDLCAEELQRRGGLTEREKQITKHLLLGRSNKEIAAFYGATERTAKFHVSNILDKLEMKTRAELLRFFF